MADDAPPGVPEWVVTYGDMMSLLLTFFIMLVSLSEIVADQRYRAILDSLQRYTGYRTGPSSPPGFSFPLNNLVEQMETLGSFSDESGRRGVKAQALSGEEIHVFRSREGQPVLVGRPVVFARGESTVVPAERAGVDAIIIELAGKPNKIELRGHVGPPPPGAAPGAGTTLSYERGRAVRALLIERGIAAERLRITAAGDTEPVPETGDALAVPLDRVEVYILDAFVGDYVGPREIPD